MAKCRNVTSRIKLDPELILMTALIIVVGESFSYLSRGNTNHGILIRIIPGIAVKDLDSEDSLLQVLRIPPQSLLNNILEEHGITFALAEQLAGKQAAHLLTDLLMLSLSDRTPSAL